MSAKLHHKVDGPAGADLTLIETDPNDTTKGLLRVAVSNGVVKDYWAGTANLTKTFTSPRTSISFANDGASDATVTINGMIFTVKPGEVLDEIFDPFSSVVITTSVAYRAWART